jgi:hypothetical protein
MSARKMQSRKTRSRRVASRKSRAMSRRRASYRSRRATMRHRGGMMDAAEAASGHPLLDRSMAIAARTAVLDDKFAEIRGMQDGGRRRRATRKGRKARKATKGRKTRGRRASRKQRGGEQDLSAPTMLLPSGMYKDAGLNPEWKSYQ